MAIKHEFVNVNKQKLKIDNHDHGYILYMSSIKIIYFRFAYRLVCKIIWLASEYNF